MEEKIILDMLSATGVSVIKKKVFIDDGVEYDIGIPHRTAYENCDEDIVKLKNDIPEPYLSTILNLWGVMNQKR